MVYCLDNLGVGGTELNAVRTAEHLDRERFELHLVTLQQDGPLRERFEAAGVTHHPLPLDSLYSPRVLAQGVRLVRLLRRLRPDVFHAHDVYSDIFGVPWARLAGVPTVIASRRWWRTVPHPAHRVATRLSYRMAHRVLANSPSVADLVCEDEGVPREKVCVVPNFVEDEGFEDPGEDARRAFLETLGVPAGAFVVGMVANLLPVKDHPTLLHAVARLLPHHSELHVVLAGEGPLRGELEALGKELQLGGHLHFAGRVSNRPNPHSYFDVSVLTSRSEAFPNTVIEAMAAGRCMIATEVGGIPDAIDHGRTGLLVPPGDDHALARTLELLLHDPDRRAALAERGHRAARERFGVKTVLEKLRRAYRADLGSEALDGHRSVQSTAEEARTDCLPVL